MLHRNLDKDNSTKTQSKFSDVFPCFDYTSQALQGHINLSKIHFNLESLLFLEDSNFESDAEF